MPKKRKTRKHKILTDQKKQMAPQTHPSISLSQTTTIHQKQEQTVIPQTTFSLPATHTKQPATTEKAYKPTVTLIATDEYGYLTKDLVKTALLTGAIVLAELLMRLFYLH